MSDDKVGLLETNCTDCGSPLRRMTIPDGALVWCDTCKESRCPLCGSDLQDQSSASYGTDWFCHACHVYADGPRGPTWPERLLESAQFLREMDAYSLRHPRVDLVDASIELCAAIDRFGYLGRQSDLFLVTMHVADVTHARMSPTRSGWRLRVGRRALEVGFDCQVSLLHLAICGVWQPEEMGLDFEEVDVISEMCDWLNGATEPTPQPFAVLRRRLFACHGRDFDLPSAWRERARAW